MILASSSQTRIEMLARAGISGVVPKKPMVDEEPIKDALLAEGAAPLDIAMALAEMKALSISRFHPDDLVIGADQILNLQGALISKATDRRTAVETLEKISDKRHQLLSAAVIAQGGKVIWRAWDQAKLDVRPLSRDFIENYLDQLGDTAYNSVGCYHLEGLGAQLFHRVEGDYYTILGLPLLKLMKFLQDRGTLLK